MKAAIQEAAKAGSDVPVGCVIILNDEIIASGYNQRESLKDPTAHAEIVAIKQAAALIGDWRLLNTVLYTTLEPCPMCAEAIIQARIPKLIFGAYDNYSGAAGSKFNLFCEGRIYPLPEVIGGIAELKCQKLLTDFFRQHARH
jgi:tRNA(adenine34) deaminase